MIVTEKGVAGTEKTLEVAVRKAQELQIKHIVISSHTGQSIRKLLEMANDLQITCVTHHSGFRENGKNEMPDEVRRELLEKGVNVLTTTHLMAGLDRAVRNKFGGVYPAEIVATTLRMFGQGVKVCVEIAGMALDAGMIPFGEEIIAIGGHGQGVDTAAVIVPAHSNHFFDTKVKEILCRPREF
ncbi:MAG: uncharacterized protein PWQ96_903 [Clostridia bacterium]|nr:hypothetical protein [Clostridiales bacterium]MDK2985261.1 uncharacterized protein [Clostridia bacterium]